MAGQGHMKNTIREACLEGQVIMGCLGRWGLGRLLYWRLGKNRRDYKLIHCHIYVISSDPFHGVIDLLPCSNSLAYALTCCKPMLPYIHVPTDEPGILV